jgi:hypothetical protein
MSAQGGAGASAGAGMGGGGGSEPWSPAALSGLVLWLDAGSGVTTAGLSSNLRVSEWQDRSGKGNHARQAEPVQQPRLVTGALSRLPAIEFNGQFTRLLIPDNETLEPGTEDFTIEIVAAWTNSFIPTDGNWGYGTLYAKQAPLPPYKGIGFWANDWLTQSANLLFQVDLSVGSWVASDGLTLNDGNFRLHGARRTGTAAGAGALQVRINGSIAAVWELGAPVDLDGSGEVATIGGGFSSTQGLDGAIAEMVFVRGALSDDDLGRLETYINQKYSLW